MKYLRLLLLGIVLVAGVAGAFFFPIENLSKSEDGYKSVFGNFSFYSYKKACGQKKTVRGSKNSRRLSNGTPAI